MRPTSLDTLAQYCLQKLGAPVIDIHVSEEQIEDRIEDAFDFFISFHGDATGRTYLKHQITQTDIDNGYITLPNSITSVVRILPFATGIGVFTPEYQMRVDEIYNILKMGGGLAEYERTMQSLNILDTILTGEKSFTFNRFTHRLNIYMNWSSLVVGQYLVIECNEVIDMAAFQDIFNERMLKKLATAYIKRQWGSNLKLHANITLPGGVTVNGQEIFDEAEKEIEDIEEEIRTMYQEPPMPELG